MSKIKTAILPVAGMGSRVMPLTLHQPKAMISIVDRPMIHYMIDEVVAAGVERIVIVTGPKQNEFRNYINHLKNEPWWRGKDIKFNFVTQKKPDGNGDAIYIARKYVGDLPFVVCFADDLLADKVNPVKKMMEVYKRNKGPVILLEPVPAQEVYRYGVVNADATEEKDVLIVRDVVEKPKPEEAPSNLTIIGRYILNSKILDEIKKLYPSKDGKEIGLADALKNYALNHGKLYGLQFHGMRFDAGSKIGILKSQTFFGLNHKEFGPEFKEYLSKETH